MSHTAKTERQQREVEFYREYAGHQEVTTVDFSPVKGPERRPWNPYWFIYDQVRNRHLNDSQRLLDFGCGIGIASVRFAHLGYQVDGFDLSDENIRIAQSLGHRYHFDHRCRFRVMAAEELAYPDNHFHIIVGIDILHHVEIEDAIAEAYRVLKPGGIAIFKEHVEVPVLDPIRNTSLFKTLAPKTCSIENHITEDERKLTPGNLDLIHQVFGQVETERFTLASRLDRLIPRCSDATRGRLQRLDRRLLRTCPPLAQLGGTAVMTCHKPESNELRHAA